MVAWLYIENLAPQSASRKRPFSPHTRRMESEPVPRFLDLSPGYLRSLLFRAIIVLRRADDDFGYGWLLVVHRYEPTCGVLTGLDRTCPLEIVPEMTTCDFSARFLLI